MAEKKEKKVVVIPSNSSLVRPGLTTPNAHDIPVIKDKLLGRIKTLNANDVRRERIPFIEALQLELEEENFPVSAEILAALIQYENNMKIPEGYMMVLLRKSKDSITYIVDQLKEMEGFRKKKNHLKQIRKLLGICDHFTHGIKDHYWIADEVYRMTSEIVERDNITVRNFRDEITYFHGKLLLEKIVDGKRAAAILEKGRSRLMEKEKLPMDEEFLLRKICGVYFRALMLEARVHRETDKAYSDELQAQALVIAIQSQEGLGIANCYIQQGDFAYEDRNFEQAQNHYMSAYANAKLERNNDVVCTIYLRIADTLKEVGEFGKSKKYLENVQTIAAAEGKQEFIADVYKLMGQIDLKMRNTKDAQNNLVKAVIIYNELRLDHKLKKVRYMAALAMAQEVIHPIVDTVLRSDKAPPNRTNTHFYDLLRWKSRGIRYWEDFKEEKGSVVDATNNNM